MACVVALDVTGIAGVIAGPVYPDMVPTCCTNVVLPDVVTVYIPLGVITVSACALEQLNSNTPARISAIINSVLMI
jgi:hypothetical protein